MRAAGASARDIQAALADQQGPADDDFEVWPENWSSLAAFIDLETSWNLLAIGMGVVVRTGLPSTEIESTLRLLALRGKQRTSMFRDIRVMERAALEFLDRQA